LTIIPDDGIVVVGQAPVSLEGGYLCNLALLEWKKDVLESAADRFERRLTEETGTLRVEMARMETRLIRWMFVFWLGQIGVTLTVVAMMRAG
jgi:hypothetical protein